MTTKKKIVSDTVAGFFGQLVEDDAVATAITKATERRTLITQLVAHRVRSGMSQGDIGKKLQRSQSSVSKIEHATDEDLRFGDILAYTRALGLSVTITMADQKLDAVTRIKHHAFRIKELLEQIVDLCDGDAVMEREVSKFVQLEVPVNLLNMVVEVAKKLRKSNAATEQTSDDFESDFLIEGSPAELQIQ